MPSSIASTLFFGTESLTERRGYDWLDLLVREPQGFSCLRLSTIGIPGAYHCTCFFVLFYESTWDPPTYRASVSLAKLSPQTETETKRKDSNSQTKQIKREPRTSESSMLLHMGSVFTFTLRVLSPRNKNNSSKCFRRNLRDTKTRHGGHISDTLPLRVGMEENIPSLHLL